MNIQLMDLNINYTKAGQGSNVLLLHGWMANIEMYRGLIDYLSQSHTVYALDTPGVGKSDEPPCAWCVDDYTDLVEAFLKAMGIEETAVIGHSFGGRIIAKMIARPKRICKITKVIMMDAAGIRPKRTWKARYKVRVFKIAKVLFNNPVMRFLYPNYIENMRKRNGSADYNSASPVMRGTLVRVVNEDLQEQIAKITGLPTLLVWGENDTTTPVKDGRRMKELIKGSEIIVVPGGHFSYLDSPGIVYAAMESFLNNEED